MADLAAITAILGSVKTATEIAKLLKDSDLSLEKAEMKLKLAELVSALADAKIELAEIQDVISEKDRIIKELEEALNTQEKVQYEKPFYWIIEDDKKDGPFCQQCRDNNKKLIRLQDHRNGLWTCPTCNNHFQDSTYRDPTPDDNPGWDAFT